MKKALFVLIVLAMVAAVPVAAQDDMMPSVTVGDQIITDGTVTIESVVSDGIGFLVVHADNEGAPGMVLGFAPLTDGLNENVEVELDTANATPVLYAMLHTDDNTEGEYEFGAVEGADAPVAVDGAVVTPAFNTNLVVVRDQVLLPGDGGEVAETVTLTADVVMSDGPGFLVIHADNEGAPGPVLGFASVDGMTEGVTVELASADVTPVVWPMLHVDTGEVGTYEFGTVEGADGPVMLGESVVTFPINVAPSFAGEAQAVVDGTVTLDSVLIDQVGWMVIHASVDGGPGPVLGFAPLEPGLNEDVIVEIEPLSSVEGAAENQIFPMVHYDTGEAGAYEFGSVEGVDLPVFVNEAVVVGPLEIITE